MKVNSKDYFFDIKGTIVRKNKILLGYSLRKNSFALKDRFFNPNKLSINTPTFTITREGKIYQHYDPNFAVNYFEISSINDESISIELENSGALYNKYGKYYNWLNEECQEKDIFKKEWKGVHYWESHPTKQLNSTYWLCKKLCEDYNIPKECLGYNNYDEISFNFNGIVCKSNFDYDYYEVNPYFNKKFPNLIDFING